MSAPSASWGEDEWDEASDADRRQALAAVLRDRDRLVDEVRALRAELDTARVASEQIAEWRSAEHVELVRLRAVEAAARKYIAGGLHDEFMAALGIPGYGDAGGGVARTPQPAEPSTGDLLRAAAAGRREYAGPEREGGSGNAKVDEMREVLLTQAATLDGAARVADGDLGPLYGWLPSWRWTAEMDRRVLAGTSGDTTRADAAALAPAAPLPSVPHGEDADDLRARWLAYVAEHGTGPGPVLPPSIRAAVERHEDRWAVFCGDPSDAEDIVNVFDDRFEAEELAQRVIDARIGHRRITITEPDWTILACCGACGAVLDGEVCCDGRLAEIEAGEAVLAENAAAALARPTERRDG